MGETESENDRDRSFYAMVGELVVIFTTLDYKLNHLLVNMFYDGDSAWIPPIFATLDTGRKIEILKAWCKMNAFADVTKPLNALIEKTEKVTKQRNIVCHTPPSRENGNWYFHPVSMAKILHPSNTYRPNRAKESLEKIGNAIVVANDALQLLEKVIEHYKQARVEEADYYKRLNSKRRKK